MKTNQWRKNLKAAGLVWVILCSFIAPAYSAPVVQASGYSIDQFAAGVGATDGMTFSPSGDLYFTDYAGGRILKTAAPFSPGVNSFEVVATGIPFPTSLAFDGSGRLFVASSVGPSSDVLQVFPDGQTTVFATGLSFPTSIAAFGNDLYVSASGDGTIRRIDSSGGVHTLLSGYGNPYGISFDSAGNLYFTDHASGAIYRWSASTAVELLGVVSPLGATFTAVRPGGLLFVSDPLAATVFTLEIPGSPVVFASGFEGKANPPVIGPTGLVFDSTGTLYVGDGSSIWKVSSNTSFPQTPVRDSFDRSDGRLGPNWSGETDLHSYKIKSNQVYVRDGGLIFWQPARFGFDQEAFVTLTKVDSNGMRQGVVLKAQGAGPNATPKDKYGAISATYNAKASAVQVRTLLPRGKDWQSYPAVAVKFQDGDQLGAQAHSNGTVDIFRNHKLIGTITLSSTDQMFFNHNGGRIGLNFDRSAEDAVFDDFGGGSIP